MSSSGKDAIGDTRRHTDETLVVVALVVALDVVREVPWLCRLLLVCLLFDV